MPNQHPHWSSSRTRSVYLKTNVAIFFLFFGDKALHNFLKDTKIPTNFGKRTEHNIHLQTPNDMVRLKPFCFAVFPQREQDNRRQQAAGSPSSGQLSPRPAGATPGRPLPPEPESDAPSAAQGPQRSRRRPCWDARPCSSLSFTEPGHLRTLAGP